MDKRVKLAAAAIVLCGGMVAASMFRHESPQGDPAESSGGGQLVLRKQGAWTHPALAPAGVGVASPAMADVTGRGRTATVLRPMDPTAPPPVLAKDYPDTDTSAGSGWPARMEMIMPRYAARKEDPVRTHEIVDGDTLDVLAERYLGSAGRWSQIYEANRDVLASPRVLPIGRKLTIPRRNKRPASDPDTAPERPMVPVQR